MTSHAAFLDLAAAAIDFRLSPPERSRLEAHLASCPACARSAAAIRGDALALAHLPSVVLPERRGAEILAAAMHPAAIRHPLRLVLVAALLALLALGSLVAGTELLRRSRDDLSVVLPVPSESPTLEPDASAAPSADPSTLPDGLIAYVGVEDGRRVIRTIHPDGSGARTIAEGEWPAWSPDGTMLAYQCPMAAEPDEPPATNICVANADGSGQRVVVTGAMKPSWSPDGSSLLFGRSVIDAGDTWIVKLDGSGARSLGGGTGSWSPNGEWIAMIGASGAEPDVTLIRPDGTDRKQLGTCRDAAWSPDGTKLACTELQGTEGVLRAITVADGVVRTMLTEHAQISAPTWLTEDRMLVMMTTEAGSPMLAGGEGLFHVDFETGERLLLIDWLSSPKVTSVAPGGVWWAVTVGTNGSSDVVVRSLSQGRTSLTTDGASMDAKWQPSPIAMAPSPPPTAPDPFSNLAFQSIHVGAEDVAWISTGTRLLRTADAGASWAEVTPPVPHVAALSVAPDANTLFIVAPEPGAAVWVTRDAGRSWAEVTFALEDGSTPPGLTFVTPLHGFARFQGEDRPLRVYETTDGGHTWIGPTIADMPTGLLGKVKGLDSGMLWLATGKADDKPFDNRLAYSGDGGATWREVRYPTGPQAPKNELKSVDALWADSTGRVVLAMSMGDSSQLYVSDDEGQSWRFVRSWPNFMSGNTTVGYHVALLSDEEWVLVAQDGSGSWSTSDGGASWREVSGTPTAMLNEIYVASADRFYAVHRCDLETTVTSEPDPECSWPVANTDFLWTTDGGRTWSQVAT